jgi:hypothetical protein
MSASPQTVPAVPPDRRGLVGLSFALIGAAIAIAVIVALIVTWPGHDDSSPSAAGPSPAPAKQAGKAPAHAAALKP